MADQLHHQQSAAGTSTSKTTDFLLLGKTGMGKSTTGNSLLKARIPEGVILNELFDTASGHDVKSTTKECKLLSSNYDDLRVLDVPGFALSTAPTSGLTIYQANLAILRDVLHVQAKHQMTFDRIVYFVPSRGVVEKADASLQDELKVMYFFFGTRIFESMVLVATERPRKSIIGSIGDMDMEETQESFQYALEQVMNIMETKEAVPAPPIVYISLEDTGEVVFTKLMSAKVVSTTGLCLEFRQNVCSKCATSFGVQGYVIGEDEKPVPYKDTKCHPVFVRKFHQEERVIGGLVILVTFGVAAFFDDTVAWFTNTQERCVECRKPPGSPGCMKVNEKYEYMTGPTGTAGLSHGAKTSSMVQHSNTVNIAYALEYE